MFRQHQTFLVAVLWMLPLVMKPSMATTKATTTKRKILDPDEKIYKEIIAGTRPVLLFTKLPKHLLVIVGSFGATMDTTKFEDTYVFKPDLIKPNNISVLLKNKQKIMSVWPKFTGPNSDMFAVGESIILIGLDVSIKVLDINSGTTDTMMMDDQYVKLIKKDILLSSSKSPTFYYNSPKDPSEFPIAAFDNANLGQATKIVFSTGPRFLCYVGYNEYAIQLYNCDNPVLWKFSTGYIDETYVMLVLEANSIFCFSRAAFDKGDGRMIAAQNFSTKHFWRYQLSSRLPATNHSSITPVSGSSSLATIPIVCVAIMLILVPICIYFTYERYCMESKSPKPQVDSMENAPKTVPSSNDKSKQTHTASARRRTKRNSTQAKTKKGSCFGKRTVDRSTSLNSNKQVDPSAMDPNSPAYIRALPPEVQIARGSSSSNNPILVTRTQYERLNQQTSIKKQQTAMVLKDNAAILKSKSKRRSLKLTKRKQSSGDRKVSIRSRRRSSKRSAK